MKALILSLFLTLALTSVSAQQKTHTVLAGETLYGIAKKYAVTVGNLKVYNPALATNTALKVGQLLTIEPYAKASAEPPKLVPAKLHTVTKGETLYAVSKKYGVTIADIKQWNGLTDLNLKPGQKIIVSKLNANALFNPVYVPATPDTPYREEDIRQRVTIPVPTPITPITEPEISIAEKPKVITETPKPAPVTEGLRTSSSVATEYPSIFNQYATRGYKIKRNKGAANYLADATSGNQNLAFYNHAETGSVIRVTNLMNHRTVFVKVIGKVPANDTGQEIIVKLSNKSAKDLGVLDEKFLVEIASYSGN